MDSRLFYSPAYDYRLLGLEKLHPFEGRKHSMAWAALERRFGADLHARSERITEPVSPVLLSKVHSGTYLESLGSPKTISRVVEVPLFGWLPNAILQRGLVTPAKYAVAGSVAASRYAVSGRTAINLGGGFHHAFRDRGEGFCFFADAALCVEILRSEQLLSASDTVLMVDLDAHRGNGFESFYVNDQAVRIFDMYNFQVYPGLHPGDPDAYPFMIPVKAGTSSEEYLSVLTDEFSSFIDSVENPRLAFYNAGTDILAGDRLGGLNVRYEAVNERDRYVIDQLRSRSIPTVVMTSGGYSKDSYRLVADLAAYVLFDS